MSEIIIESGAVSSGLSISYGDTIRVSGGTAVDTTISGGGMSIFMRDGAAINTVMSGGTLYASGGRVESTTLEGSAYISATEATVANTTVMSGGSVTARCTLNDTGVSSGGEVDVYGGTVNNLTVYTLGRAYFSNDGTVVNNLILAGEPNTYTLASAGNGVTINGATVTGGYLSATKSAAVNDVMLSGSGNLTLSGGATANNVEINEGGSMSMTGNTSMSEVTVNYGGWFSAGFGGYYGSYTIYEEDGLSSIGGAVRENGGAVYLSSATVVRYDSTLGEYGDYIYSSGVVYPVEFLPNTFREIVYSNGRQGTVHSNTMAYNITAINGGLTVYDGGIVTGYTVTPVTYDKPFERWEYSSSYNAETDDWDYTSEFVSGIETVTDLGNLTVVAGGTVTGLVAQAMPGDEYSWNTYLNFEIAPNTLISGTIDGEEFDVSDGMMRPGHLKNANLTYTGQVTAYGVTQVNGSATFNEGVITSNMIFSGTNVTFNSGVIAEYIRTAPMPYVYTEYEGGFGDQEEEPEETIVSSFMGASATVNAGAQVRSIEMTDKDYLHMQVAPNTVLTGTSGGVELNMTNGVFTSASLGSTYVEVMGGTTSIDETTAGTAVTIAGGTVSDLIVNPGACVSAAEGATALNLTENGGAVLLGWGNEIPATITYSINSNTFSYDHLVGGDNPITVHKNTSAIDNIMFGGELQVFSGGVVSNFYTVGSGMNMNMISLYEGAIVTNIDTVRYSDPGKYHPGQIEFNKNVTANVARLTDYDGITLFVTPETVITNASVDDVPFSVENGVLSGFMGGDDGWFGDTIGIYRGAGMINCRTDQWANVNIWQGGYGSNNTFADGYVYVGDTAYDDESEEGGIALLEKSTLGVAGNRDKATILYVRQNGVVRDITVNSGSGIEVSYGGKLTGKIRKSGATINISNGGYLDFDITAQDALTEARVDSLWNVTNNGRYSITIDGTNQAGGTYVLADSTYFNDIFFWNDNAVIYFDLMDVSGSTFGYFYMAEENQYRYDEETGDEWYESVVAINYVATSKQQPNFGFSLSEGKRYVGDGGYNTTLLFTVDSNNVAPEWVVAPTVTADIITFTPSDVTLTAVFSEDSVTREYSLDGQIWQTFEVSAAQDGTGAPVTVVSDDGTITTIAGGDGTVATVPPATLTVTENGTYFFRGTNANGVVSDVTSYRVSNIDKVAPTAPTDLSAVATEDGVRLSWAEASDDYSGIRKYIVTYKEAGSDQSITVETPYKFLDILNPVPNDSAVAGTVIPAADPSDYEWSVQAVDYAGNVSEATEFFNGIPGPVASASITTPTNGTVNVVIGSLNPDVAQYEYSLDDQKTWNQYDLEGLVVSENITVWLRGITVDGVYTKTTFIKIDNIDLIPPDAPIPDASTQEPTNGYVIVTATFSNDSVTRECSIDGVNWVEYTSNGLSFVDNGFAYFRGIDAAGNISDVAVYEVSNIDKVPPTAPVASLTAAETFEGVFVSAVFSDDSITQEYSFDCKQWVAYDGGVPVSELGTTVFFRGIDAAGNESEVTTVTVNSFTVGPEAPVASANITAPTNQNVTVTATFAEDAVLNQYSLNGQDWFSYDGSIVLEANNVIYFRSLDADGRESSITTLTVDNIDKEPPAAPYAYASTTDWTNQDVTVFARFSEDSVVRQYRLISHGEEWFDYPDSTGVVLSENDSVVFRGIDAAGNESNVLTLFSVTNIDKVAPTAPTVSVSAAVLPAGKGIDVTATFSDDSVKQEYSLDGQTWNQYNGPVLFTELGTAYFRGTDAAGNVSDVTKYEVTKLSLGPAAPFAFADITAPTNQNVTVYATFDDSAVVRRYAIDSLSSWYDYTDAGVVVSKNSKVYFAYTNADGEGSDMTTFTVSNIDKVAPEKPVASASTTENTFEPVVVTATFSEDSVKRQYSFDGDAWYDYPEDGVRFEKNGYVYFRGIDAAGNESDFAAYEVTNILEVEPDDEAADDGWNDAVYDKKKYALTEAAGAVKPYDLTKLYRNVTNYGLSGSILFDEAGSISVNGMQNAVGGKRTENGKTVYDVDFVRVEMSCPGYVYFTVSASAPLNLSLWKYTKSDTKVVFKNLGWAPIGEGDNVLTRQFLLEKTEEGVSEYYIMVEGASPKKNGPSYYNVSLDVENTVLYPAADNSDDWTDMKTEGQNGKFRKLGALENHYDQEKHSFDSGILIFDWVGPGDDVDYFQFTLEHAAKLSFAITATGAASLGIYSLKEGKTNKLTEIASQKSLTQGGKVDKNKFTTPESYEYALTTSEITFEAGTYYLSVGAVTTKTPGEPGSYYSVDVSGEIYFQANNSDDWTDMKDQGPKGHVGNVGKLEDRYTEFEGFDDGALVVDWIGTGDDADFFKFTLEHNAKLRFVTTATDGVSFSLSSLAGSPGNYKLKSIVKSTTLKKGGKIDENEYAYVDGYSWALTTSDVLLEAGTYYFGVKKSYATKSGSADYTVDLSGKIFLHANTKDDGVQFRKNGSPLDVGSLGLLSDSKIGQRVEEDWVGFGDAIDYKTFLLAGDTKLNFTISATDSVKLTVYAVKKNNKGTAIFTAFSSNVAKITNKTGDTDFYGTASTGSIFLKSEAGVTYCLSVESTNAKKGGDASYTIDIDSDGSALLPIHKDPDGVDNSGLLIKTKGFHGGTVEIMDLEQWASDSLVVNGNIGYQGWVGYGDAVDTLGFSLTADTPIQSISIESTDQISVVLSQVIRNGKSGYKTKKILSSTKLYATDPLYTGYSYALIWDGLDGTKKKTINLGAGDYIISIKSTNASKGGNASYKLTLGCEALQKVQNADALTDLSMPETSDELALSNDLCLGQFAENASAISSAVTDALDDKLGSVMNASWTTLA